MSAFIVICTFKPDTEMTEVFAVVAEEMAQVKALEAEGRLGSVHLSLARGTVFIEVFALDEILAIETVASLPMAKWWDLDVYQIQAPAIADGAA